MPFGLCNSPATFQRLMDRIFLGKKDTGSYLDDVVNYATQIAELLDIIDVTLKTFIKAGLKCRASKCQIGLTSIEYLGFRISAEGMFLDDRKYAKIEEWPVPKTGAEIASFLGLCNYFRGLISGYAALAAPLYIYVRTIDVSSKPEISVHFLALRDALLSTKVLRVPNPMLPFVLETNASNIAVGAVLKQMHEGKLAAVSFFSHALSKTESNYSVY